MPERIVELFLNETTFYFAWIITTATIAGLIWQGSRWVIRKIQHDKEERKKELMDLVDNAAKEIATNMTNDMNLIRMKMDYQDQNMADIKAMLLRRMESIRNGNTNK